MWYGTIRVEREKATHTQWLKSDEDWTEFWRRGQLRLEVNLIVLGTIILNVRLKTTYSRPKLPLTCCLPNTTCCYGWYPDTSGQGKFNIH